MTVALEALLILLLPTALGVGLLRLAGRLPVWAELPVGAAMGVGVCGALSFLGLALFDRLTIVPELLAVGAVWIAPHRTDAAARGTRALAPRWWRGASVAALLGLAGLALFVWLRETVTHPDGGWDAWDFWIMRARFFVRADEEWARAYAEVIDWTHPGYPPLWSSAIARGFALVGHESRAVPAILSAAFVVGTVALLGHTVTRLRGPAQGTLAAATLLSTPFFVVHGASEYADLPLAFFFLALWSFAALHDETREPRHLVLAGLAASMAVLTKNEGLIVTLAFVLARGWETRAGGRWRAHARWLTIGFAPLGALYVWFRARYAAVPASADFYAAGSQRFDGVGPVEHVRLQLSDGDRWLGLVESWGHWLFSFDRGWPAPLLVGLAIYAAWVGLVPRAERSLSRSVEWALLIEALVLSVAFVAWSRWEIRVHMEAVERLLFQALPTGLLGLFLALRAPFASAASEERVTGSR